MEGKGEKVRERTARGREGYEEGARVGKGLGRGSKSCKVLTDICKTPESEDLVTTLAAI